MSPARRLAVVALLFSAGALAALGALGCGDPNPLDPATIRVTMGPDDDLMLDGDAGPDVLGKIYEEGGRLNWTTLRALKKRFEDMAKAGGADASKRTRLEIAAARGARWGYASLALDLAARAKIGFRRLALSTLDSTEPPVEIPFDVEAEPSILPEASDGSMARVLMLRQTETIVPHAAEPASGPKPPPNPNLVWTRFGLAIDPERLEVAPDVRTGDPAADRATNEVAEARFVQLEARLREVRQQRPSVIAVLDTPQPLGREVLYRDVVRAVRAFLAAGFTTVRIVGIPPPRGLDPEFPK